MPRRLRARERDVRRHPDGGIEEDGAVDDLGPVGDQLEQEPAAEAVADPVGALEVERAQRVVQVVEVRAQVPRRLPGREAVPAEVDGDDAVGVAEPRGQAGEPARVRVHAVEADHRRRVRRAPFDVMQDRYSSPSSPLPEGR